MDEKLYMNTIRNTWQMRVNSLGLKPYTNRRKQEMLSFLQGALSALVAVGVMQRHRADQIAFLVTVGRGEEFLEVKEEVPA